MGAFKNRVFGCAIVKAVNANYNADFTHQPRTLPDGIVYATDKAFKYSIRNYLTDQFPDETILYFKRLNADMNPLTLADTYDHIFGEGKFKEHEKNKSAALRNLLGCLDIRLFGATFAGKAGTVKINLSIHGPVQVNHGLNRFPNNDIYSEQIMSPFRNPEAEGKAERGASTLGQQSKLREGHYVHHFSINPKNLEDVQSLVENPPQFTDGDIAKLKEAMRYGVSYYDSAAKAGTDNELLLWLQLKPNSRRVLPVFTEFITVTRDNNKTIIDFGELKGILNNISGETEKVEVYYIPQNTIVKNLPETVAHFDLATETPLK